MCVVSDSQNARSIGSQSPDLDPDRSQSQADDTPNERISLINGTIKCELTEED